MKRSRDNKHSYNTLIIFAVAFFVFSALSTQVYAVCVVNSDCPANQYCNWWSFFACIDCGTYWGQPTGGCFAGGPCWSCCGNSIQPVTSSCPAHSYYECGLIHCGTQQSCDVLANVHCLDQCGASAACDGKTANFLVSSSIACDDSCEAVVCDSSKNCNQIYANNSNYYCTKDSSSWAWRTSYPYEVCNDGIDNNCNGNIDCSDSACPCPSGQSCNATTHACYTPAPTECTSDGMCAVNAAKIKGKCDCPLSGCSLHTLNNYKCYWETNCITSAECDVNYCCSHDSPGPGESQGYCKTPSGIEYILGFIFGTQWLCA